MKKVILVLALSLALATPAMAATSSYSGSTSTKSSTSSSPSGSSSSSTKAPTTSTRSGSFSGSTSTKPSSTTKPSTSSSGSYSGSVSNKPTPTPSKGGSYSGSVSTKPATSGSYSSGVYRPSGQVYQATRTNPNTGTRVYGGSYYDYPPSGASHVYSAAAGFAVGTWYGSMMHPWGSGYYPVKSGGYIYKPFNWGYLILDIIVLALLVWLVVYLIRRYTRD